MKKLIFLSLAVLFFASPIFANDSNNYQKSDERENYVLENLDKELRTCDVGSEKEVVVKKATARKALEFLFNFRWWKIKNLTASLHDDYAAWHASRVYAGYATAKAGGDVSELNFKNGLVTKQTFIHDLAMIAYTNDVPQ